MQEKESSLLPLILALNYVTLPCSLPNQQINKKIVILVYDVINRNKNVKKIEKYDISKYETISEHHNHNIVL